MQSCKAVFGCAMTLKCIGMHLGGYVYSQVKPLTSKAAEKASLRLLLTVGSRQVQVCELGYVCPNSDAGAESALLQTASTMHVTKLIDYNTESILNESSRCRMILPGSKLSKGFI